MKASAVTSQQQTHSARQQRGRLWRAMHPSHAAPAPERTKGRDKVNERQQGGGATSQASMWEVLRKAVSNPEKVNQGK